MPMNEREREIAKEISSYKATWTLAWPDQKYTIYGPTSKKLLRAMARSRWLDEMAEIRAGRPF